MGAGSRVVEDWYLWALFEMCPAESTSIQEAEGFGDSTVAYFCFYDLEGLVNPREKPP